MQCEKVRREREILNLTDIETIVAPYVTNNYLINRTKDQVFQFDNNLFSGLAKTANKHLLKLQQIIEANQFEGKDVIIPSYILWETGKNLDKDEAYRSIYEEIFREISQRTNIFVVTTEQAFEIFSVSYQNKSEAFELFKSIAVEMNRAHLDLKDDLSVASNIQQLDEALKKYEDDLGERQAFLIMTALYSDGYEYTEFGSNEHKGVYLKIEEYAMQDDLRSLMNIHEPETMFEIFKIVSINVLISKTINYHSEWSSDEIFEFLKDVRTSGYHSSPVIYKHSTNAFYRKLENLQLSELITNFADLEILF